MRYDNVFCSQCGRGFGPGDHGFSHCEDHPGHVRDMAFLRADLNKLAAELKEIADDIDPRLDGPRDTHLALRGTLRAFQTIMAELRRR